MKTLHIVTNGQEASGMFVEVWGLDENQVDSCLSRGPLNDDDNLQVELDTEDKRIVIVQA